MRFIAFCAALGFLTALAAAEVITFEGFASPGGVANVNPAAPYLEKGFRFTPNSSQSAVFDAAGPVDMPGNSASSFFGWQDGTTVTMDREDGATFPLSDCLLGPSDLAFGPASIVLIAHFGGGATDFKTFPILTTATLAHVGWTNLLSIDFMTTDDAAMDNLMVPAPGAGMPIMLAGMVAMRRRR